jgi:hypothetical protein
MMRFLQSLIFVLGALLLLASALSAVFMADGNFMGFVWAAQILGLAAIIGVLAVAAVQPDQPIKLKRPAK